MTAVAISGHYNLTFVALSVLIAILSAYAALDLAGRVFSSRTRMARLAWLGCGATTMGVGIWSMHYIGMLALKMDMPVLYHWPTVVLSMVAAVAASGVALSIVSRAEMGWFTTLAGSLVMGSGIAAMHYVGMEAMRMDGTMTYSRPIVAVSIALAVVIAFVALRLTFATRLIRTDWSWQKGLCALVMGLAIPVMHYTGMAAATWMPGVPMQHDRYSIGISDLGTASIALVTVIMLCLVFVAVIIDRRFSLQEHELEDSEQRYRRIVASSFDAFLCISAENLVTDWNAQAENTFGWSESEATGKNLNEILCLKEEPEPADALVLLAREGRVELQARHRDGRLFPVEMTLSAIENGGKQVFAAFIHDVTERKSALAQAEHARTSAESSNKAKSEFLANMSHEIRTPLNGVIGMTELALETELTAEQRDYLETVKLSADGLLGVINDILDFSKIEAGKVDLEDVRVDVRECIEATLKTLALRADEKSLELLCDVRGEVPEAIVSDPVRLRQIVTNLAGNAIKFTDKGEVSVTVATESIDTDRPLLHVTVADTGIGIAPEKLGHIFESFSQADTSTTRQYGGTGLGLTISRRLIEMMGGRIWVESQQGQGSQFHFEIPLREAVTLGQTCKVSTVVERLHGVKVLIIDDNRTNRRILEGLLLRWGMNPVTAADGESALERMEEALRSNSPFQLIVTDMHMPKMDGFMVVREFQKEEQFSTATVMMLSSGGHRGDAARCQELGIAAYLLKPVRQNELQEAMCRALGDRPEEKAKPMITQESLIAARPQAEFLNILLAEDNEVNQKLAVRLLQKRGHTVTVVGNGKLAVEAVAAGAFDLVLMDVQMPEMDGIEATMQIRQRERREGDSHQPIVAMTALVMKGDKERCLEATMDGYVSKPIRPQELDAVLELYTSQKREQASQQAAAAPPQSSAAIDLNELLERVDGDVEFIGELTEVLREDCPRKLTLLREHLSQADGPAVKRAAHGLKGALANLAARPAAALAGQMEACGSERKLAEARALLPALEAEIDRVLLALSNLTREAVQ